MFGLTGSSTDLLKEGTKHLSGIDEAVAKNLEACKQLAKLTRSSFGPNGMNKLVVNHLEKLFVTSDAATVLKETDVAHPAAKMVCLAANAQETEVGDGTNLVVMLAGQLMENAEGLLRMGLHPSDVIHGYQKAHERAVEILEGLVVETLSDPTDSVAMSRALKSVVSAKQYGLEDTIVPLIVEACNLTMPKNPKNFNVENVRISKMLGASVAQSKVVKGVVCARPPEGSVKKAEKCKLAIFSCGLELGATEAKGTVLLNNAQELMDYNKSEEKMMDETIKAIADSGAKVVVVSGSISDLGSHYVERHGMMLVKILSKFELRRLCRTVGATACVRLGAPTAEEMGYCDHVFVEEFGDRRVTIFQQDNEDSRVATIVVRAATENMMDDVERVIDDGVNTFRNLCRDGRLLPGAGAVDIELASQLASLADATPGLDQHAIRQYAEAFECVPRALADNVGHNAIDGLSNMYAAHKNGRKNDGVNVEGDNTDILIDAKEAGIFDHYLAKWSSLKHATTAAVTVLRVDQIIMARPAGGPKVRDPGARDAV